MKQTVVIITVMTAWTVFATALSIYVPKWLLG